MFLFFLESAGGLGNQLFIWNLAHVLATVHKRKVVVIFPGKRKDRDNNLIELKEFCSHDITLLDSTLFARLFLVKDRFVKVFPKKKKFINRLLRFVEVGEPEAHIDIERLRPLSVVRGFHQVTNLIAIGFPIFADELLEITKRTFQIVHDQKIQFGNQYLHVAHLRHGDYEDLKDIYGILDTNYYSRIMLERKWVSCVVVSDNPSVPGEVLRDLPNALYLGPHQVSAWEAFAIMSQAKELIIANSTFSWWAGKVCQLRGGKVFAPKPWHINSPYSREYLNDSKFEYRTSSFK